MKNDGEVMKKNQVWKVGCSIIFAFFFCLILSSQASAHEKTNVLRVAFSPTEGIIETNENGEHVGIVVDFLNEIAKYTNWKYEYVEVDPERIPAIFKEKNFDLMGGTYYLKELEQYFAYPSYNCGYMKSVLLARRDDDRMQSYKMEDFDGKTIGVYRNAKENIRLLKRHLDFYNIKYRLKYYESEDLTEGNLYKHLENGEVDLLLGNGSENNPKLRTVMTFNSQPHYIVTGVKKQKILESLNMALGKIYEANPDFAEQCYEKNFPDDSQPEVVLSREERDYVAEKKTVKVAVQKNFHPLYCLDVNDSGHNGIIPDILKEISDFSGLTFEYLPVEGYQECLQLVKSGEADMAGFFLGDDERAIDMEFSLSEKYVILNNCVVRNKFVTYPSEHLRCAILGGRELSKNMKADEFLYFDNVTDMLTAVNDGKADFMYGLSSRIEAAMQQNYFPNLVPVTLYDDRTEVGFALSRPTDVQLLTIINKSIHQIPERTKDMIANNNVVSLGTKTFSLTDLVYANPLVFFCTVMAILIVCVVIVILVSRLRLKTAMMQSELREAEAESRAKGQFLSNMSHEIRTPMNAVIGLVDLTCMMENVPEDVEKNLLKIRSSSHYLLGLINDILDMSKIDNHAMKIANEPFSLHAMLDELQSMMGAEAGRHALQLHSDIQIQHTKVVGDMIRLRQVLTNLLSNAVKFTPAGGSIRLTVKEQMPDEAGADYYFEVTDNGVGICQEDQKRIFDAFEQGGENRFRSQGTGLGLPISKNIVQKMGGVLNLVSAPGAGSTFSFCIRMQFGELSDKQAFPVSSQLLDGTQILMAEDNDLNAEIAISLLNIQGAAVQHARDGKEVVEMFEKSRPGEYQVILMDIQMPRMNGLEAAREIRALAHPDAKMIPIIAMTANSFQEDIDAAIQAGMNQFVSKPLDVNLLYGTLEEVLSQRKDSEN